VQQLLQAGACWLGLWQEWPWPSLPAEESLLVALHACRLLPAHHSTHCMQEAHAERLNINEKVCPFMCVSSIAKYTQFTVGICVSDVSTSTRFQFIQYVQAACYEQSRAGSYQQHCS